MITTKAYITKVPDPGSNIFQVNVPLMQDNVSSEALFDALLCNSSNSEFNNYHVGDCVFVDFEDDKYNTAIILGKLFTEQKNESTSYNVINNLKVTGSATLPSDTTFGGKYTVKDFFNLYQGGSGGGGTETINPDDLKQYVQWVPTTRVDEGTGESYEVYGDKIRTMTSEEYDALDQDEEGYNENTYYMLSSTPGFDPEPEENHSFVLTQTLNIYVDKDGDDSYTEYNYDKHPYKTLARAVREASRYTPLYANSGIFVNIYINPGSVINSQIIVRNINLSYVRICANRSATTNWGTTANPITLNTSGWVEVSNSRSTKPLFAAVDGGAAPTICCVFTGAGTSMVCGLFCDHGGFGFVEEGSTCGFINMHDGCLANNEASIVIRNAVCRNMDRWGVHARHNGEISVRGTDCSNCGNGGSCSGDTAPIYGCAVYSNRNADVDAKNTTTTGSRVGIMCDNNSRVNANETGGISGRIVGVAISSGGIVTISGGMGISYCGWYRDSDEEEEADEFKTQSISANSVSGYGIVFVGGAN